MSIWASRQGRPPEDSDGQIVNNTVNVFFNVETNRQGEFTIDLTRLNFDVTEVLNVQTTIINQALSTVVSVIDIASVLIVDVTSTVIKGVVVLGNTIGAAAVSAVDTLRRAVAGIEVRVFALVVRA